MADGSGWAQGRLRALTHGRARRAGSDGVGVPGLDQYPVCRGTAGGSISVYACVASGVLPLYNNINNRIGPFRTPSAFTALGWAPSTFPICWRSRSRLSLLSLWPLLQRRHPQRPIQRQIQRPNPFLAKDSDARPSNAERKVVMWVYRPQMTQRGFSRSPSRAACALSADCSRLFRKRVQHETQFVNTAKR